MSNVYPAYALGYKKEYLLVRGIDKYFKYFVKNLHRISTVIFEEEKNMKRLNKINYRIDLIDKLHTPNTDLKEIDTTEVLKSLYLNQELNDFRDYYYFF